MAGLQRQDKNFWGWLKDKDFISLCETWIEEKDWVRFKEKLPGTHWWAYSPARREKRKGRARGGLVLGRKKNWGEGDSILGEEREEGILISNIQGKGGRRIR